MHTTFTLTEELTRKAVFRVWARRMRVVGIVAIVPCSAYTVSCLITRDTSTTAICVGLWLFVAGVFAAVYWRWLSQSLSRFRLMNDPTVDVTISNDEFRWKTCLGDSRLSWRVFEAVWRAPDIWLLFLARTSHLILPTDAISNEDRELICLKVRENGGQIR